MLGKIILWITAVSFAAYGVACLVWPALPADYAGLAINSGDAYSEMGAMYGGLQIGFGLFCLLGATRTGYFRPALVLLVLCVGLLALGRAYSTITGADPVGGYTWGAMAFEFSTAILAAIALRTS